MRQDPAPDRAWLRRRLQGVRQAGVEIDRLGSRSRGRSRPGPPRRRRSDKSPGWSATSRPRRSRSAAETSPPTRRRAPPRAKTSERHAAGFRGFRRSGFTAVTRPSRALRTAYVTPCRGRSRRPSAAPGGPVLPSPARREPTARGRSSRVRMPELHDLRVASACAFSRDQHVPERVELLRSPAILAHPAAHRRVARRVRMSIMWFSSHWISCAVAVERDNVEVRLLVGADLLEQRVARERPAVVLPLGAEVEVGRQHDEPIAAPARPRASKSRRRRRAAVRWSAGCAAGSPSPVGRIGQQSRRAARRPTAPGCAPPGPAARRRRSACCPSRSSRRRRSATASSRYVDVAEQVERPQHRHRPPGRRVVARRTRTSISIFRLRPIQPKTRSHSISDDVARLQRVERDAHRQRDHPVEADAHRDRHVAAAAGRRSGT